MLLIIILYKEYYNKFNIKENYVRLFGKKVECKNKKTIFLIKMNKIKDNEKILQFKS